MCFVADRLNGFKLLAFLSLFLSALLAPASGQTTEGIKIAWEKDFKAAKKKAREQMKPMLLDFTASWCKPCIAMDQEFWVLDNVIKAVGPFVAVKVDFDSDTGVVNRYGISAIPNVVFTDPLGNVIANQRGFSRSRVSELFKILEIMPKDFSPLKPYYDQIEEDEDNGLAQMTIADAYRKAKMYQLSNQFYKKALKTKALKTDDQNRERIAAIIGVNHFFVEEYDAASKAFEDYLKDFPNGTNRERLLLYAVVNGARRKKKKEAQKYLDMLRAEFPNSKRIEEAARTVAGM